MKGKFCILKERRIGDIWKTRNEFRLGGVRSFDFKLKILVASTHVQLKFCGGVLRLSMASIGYVFSRK